MNRSLMGWYSQTILLNILSLVLKALPRWLRGEHVGLMTWWLRVRSLVEATFLSGVFSPLTSAEACEKSSQWILGKKSCVSTGRKHICVLDRLDMTLAIKVALNPNTTKQLILMNFLYLKALNSNTTSKWLNHISCYYQSYKTYRKRQRMFLRMVGKYGHWKL